MARSSWLRHHDFGGENSPTAPQLERAFEILNYDFGYDEQRAEAVEFLRRFRQRWGGLSIDILAEIARRFVPTDDERMALGLDAVLKSKTSEEFDTRFVLAVLGVVRPSEAPSLLLPYLMSLRAQERWFAAFGLAAMHDEHALPAIEQILVEFVGLAAVDIRDLPHLHFPDSASSVIAGAGGLGRCSYSAIHTCGPDCHRARRGDRGARAAGSRARIRVVRGPLHGPGGVEKISQ